MSPAPPIYFTVHLQVAVTAAGLHAVHLLLALVLLPSAESDAHEVDIAAVLDHLLSVPRHVSHLSCNLCHVMHVMAILFGLETPFLTLSQLSCNNFPLRECRKFWWSCRSLHKCPFRYWPRCSRNTAWPQLNIGNT